MNFFEKFMPKQAPENAMAGGVEKQEQIEIKNTASFQEAITAGNLEQAEAWLYEAKIKQEAKYDERWFDHREREIFKAYCEKQDWSGAKRIVEASLKEASKEGRKERLAQLAEKPYEEI